MTSINPSENIHSSGSAYENAMKNILKKRTGKSFQRNLEAAPVPVQETRFSHEEVADQIFDNIIRRKREKAQQAKEASHHSSPPDNQEQRSLDSIEPGSLKPTSENSHLDEILWPDEVLISDQTSQFHESSPEEEGVYETPREHLDALAQQYAAELDQILGFD